MDQKGSALSSSHLGIKALKRQRSFQSSAAARVRAAGRARAWATAPVGAVVFGCQPSPVLWPARGDVTTCPGGSRLYARYIPHRFPPAVMLHLACTACGGTEGKPGLNASVLGAGWHWPEESPLLRGFTRSSQGTQKVKEGRKEREQATATEHHVTEMSGQSWCVQLDVLLLYHWNWDFSQVIQCKVCVFPLCYAAVLAQQYWDQSMLMRLLFLLSRLPSNIYISIFHFALNIFH